MNQTTRVIEFATEKGMTIRQLETEEELTEVLEELSEEPLNICRSQGFVENLRDLGGYQWNEVVVWKVTTMIGLVGLALFAPVFSERGRARLVGVDSYRVLGMPQEGVSDLILMCARGASGVGRLLTLLARSLSGRAGCFTQVPRHMTLVTAAKHGEFVAAESNLYADAAEHILHHYGFTHRVRVEIDGEDNGYIHGYYVDQPLGDDELEEFLREWTRKQSEKIIRMEEEGRVAIKNLVENLGELGLDPDRNVSLVLDAPHSPRLSEQDWLNGPFDELGPDMMNDLDGNSVLLPGDEFVDVIHLSPDAPPDEVAHRIEDVIVPEGKHEHDEDAYVRQRHPPHPEREEIRPGRKPKNRRCPVCGVQFTRSTNMRRHLEALHHLRLDQRPYECPACHERFDREADLFTHIKRIHEEERTEECPHCHYVAKTKSDLYAHIRRRHGEEAEEEEEENDGE